MRRALLLLGILVTAVPITAQVPFAEAVSDTTHALGLPRCTTQTTEHATTELCLGFDADESLVVTVERGTVETARWAYLGAPSLLDLRAFMLPQANGPEADTMETVLVATLDGVSNGVGVSYWTATVLRDGVPAYRFRVEEFGETGGSFIVAEGELVLWATEWVGGPDPTGERGEGLYFTGRPFAVTPDGLVPRTDLDLRARRFLESFVRDERGPVAWLLDERAETRAEDPALTGCTSTSEVVTLADIAAATDEWRQPFTRAGLDVAEADSVQVEALAVGLPTYTEAGIGVPYVGDVATDRLFAPGYVPDLAAHLDQPLRLETCEADGLVKTRVLWVERTGATPR
ncbi:MAG: hypothetical protein AAGF99_09750 [Bacteroidota bacterium]